jgi:hypothetical protein
MFGWLGKLFGGAPEAKPRSVPDRGPENVYAGLRGQALSLTRADAGIPDLPPNIPVWGLLMECGFPSATATLLGLADGTSSLYLSSGGGFIGGQAHETVREANARFVGTANHLHGELVPTFAFPPPDQGSTVFYALTDAGVLTGGGADEELGSGRHPLSHLFMAGHGVLTELRLLSPQ